MYKEKIAMMNKMLVLMVLAGLVFSVCLIGSAGQKEDVPKNKGKLLCEKVLKNFEKGNVEQGLSLLEPHILIPKRDFAELKIQSTKILNDAKTKYGKVTGYELIREGAIKKFAFRYVYVLKLEKTMVRLVFVFYKSGTRQYLFTFSLDDEFDDMFKEL